MQLGRMDDVAGCRLIFADIVELSEFRDRIHKARFKHRMRNHDDKYDYILNPKDSGYRGVHDVYEYDVNSEAGKDYKGLYIEVQYRTVYQHAWATAVEVVGHITENQPKFDQGDDRFRRQLRLASEIISRAWENLSSSEPEMLNEEVVEEFVALEASTHMMAMLRGLNASNTDLADNKNVILLLKPDNEVEMMSFRDATEALKVLFEMEKKQPTWDIVLVRGDSNEDVRVAFKNYFSDAREFLSLIDDGCKRLMDHRAV